MATPNETRTMQCDETPVAKTKGCSHRSRWLWCSGSISKKLLADNYREFPVAHQWHHLMRLGQCKVPNHQWPGTKKKQKLQPSISFFLVSGRMHKILADNDREFPVAHQWQRQMKPGQCNVPKHPWPGTKSCSHRSRCLWSLEVSVISSWPTIIESFLWPMNGTT